MKTDKAGLWKVIGQEKYLEWAGKGVMTPTHVNHYIKIVKALYEDNKKNSDDSLEEYDHVYEYDAISEQPEAKDALFIKAKVAGRDTML